MIKKLTVINYLEEAIDIVLNDPNPDHGMIITNISGLGSPKANVNRIANSTMDGSIFNSARIEERNIIINLLFSFSPTIEDARQRTYKYFPLKKQVSLIIETDNRILTTVGIVESNESDIFSKDEGCQISIICCDPYLYSIFDSVTILYGIEPLFEFEFENDSLTEKQIEFGSYNNSSEKNIIYDGDSEIGITIKIHIMGSIGDITIYNTGTRESLKINISKIKDITGYEISSGDDIIISTVSGNKKVELLRNGKYINILNALNKNSDWLKLVKGINVLAYTAEYGSENLQLNIENKNIYEGV